MVFEVINFYIASNAGATTTGNGHHNDLDIGNSSSQKEKQFVAVMLISVNTQFW